MVFSSVIFLVYFLPTFLVLYFLTPQRFKNPVLLLSSIFFYAWGAPRFIFVILATTTVDFYFAQLLHNSQTEKKRKLFLVLSLCLNVGLLFYFKYCNFFIDNINSVLGAMGVKQLAWVSVVLPIGISFYTFESITYVVDVYRRIHKPLDNFWQYQLYIILFPKLIAGPIVRYHDIARQIEDRSKEDTVDNKLTPKRKLEQMVKQIRNTKEWMEQIRAKAKERNISVDSMIVLDALWMIEQESK